MGQIDVLLWLVNERKIGQDKHYSIKEIQRGLRERGLTNGQLQGVGADLYRLCASGYVEFKGQGLWRHKKLFRVKEKYKDIKI